MRPAPPDIRIVAGGRPSATELAAVVLALTPAAPAPPPPAPDHATPTWARAAILEGVGHRPFVAMPDLAAGRFPLS